jgi:hypothetical protein
MTQLNLPVVKSTAEQVDATTATVIPVDIDIKPGSDPNSINCRNKKGIVTIAILTTDDFDATTVDHTTVTFEGALEAHVNKKTGEPRRHEGDVDGDGDLDLVFHFRFGDTGLDCFSTEGTLVGETYDGIQVEGIDAVRMVGQGGGGAVLFTEDFNGYIPGSSGTQSETGLALGVFGSVPGWTGGGINHSHAVDLDPGLGTDWAVQFAGGSTAALGNTLTLVAGIPANDGGVLYQVSFDAAPTVWQVGSQSTRAVDGVRIDILRSDNSVLASFLHQPGAWPGGPDAQDSFNRASFTYTGDGTGDVRIHMVIDPPAVPHFGGAIDNLQVLGPAW